MVNVGLLTAPPTPRARHAPLTNVVFPAPSSPSTSTTCPGLSRPASLAPSASVSAGLLETCLHAINPGHCIRYRQPGHDRFRRGPGAGTVAAPLAHQRPRLTSLFGTDTAKAAGLAGAMIANNVIALASTFVFARLIDDYGALAALISYLLILTVAGQAMQVATAREAVLGHLGEGEEVIATMKRWSRSLPV